MRRAEREITDRAEMEEILLKAEVIHLGLYDGKEAYVVPMNFGYADGAIYVHGAIAGRKADILKTNPRVCFETYCDYELVRGPVACSFSAQFRSVIGYGVAAVVTDDKEREKGLTAIMMKLAKPPFYYNPEALVKTNVIKIEISSMTGKKLMK